MGDVRDEFMGSVTFAFKWLGLAALVCLFLGIAVGLFRDDVPGTLAFVVQWGMTAAAVMIVAAVGFRRT